MKCFSILFVGGEYLVNISFVIIKCIVIGCVYFIVSFIIFILSIFVVLVRIYFEIIKYVNLGLDLSKCKVYFGVFFLLGFIEIF